MASKEECRAFIEKYAPLAMEQQQKFGIPASITLAQMALESSWGKSQLSERGNNYFGVKAHGSYLQEGRFGYYNDDKPNEKFCHYGSAQESLYDHSRVLMADRYMAICGKLSSTDYEAWAKGIKAGGYATGEKYASSLISVIEQYGLQKYDQQAVAQATQPIGYMRGKDFSQITASFQERPLPQTAEKVTILKMEPEKQYFLPIQPDKNNQIRISSDFGMRKDPIDGDMRHHNGIDISVNHVPVFATEDQGKITFAGVTNGGGNTIKVEYSHSDGKKYEVTYMHLSEFNAKVGDVVKAGQQIGVSGNTGKSTGPHLHLEVKESSSETPNWASVKQIDPARYLAEINVRSGFDVQYNLKNGMDVLADYKDTLQLDNPLEHYQLQQVPMMQDNQLAGMMDLNFDDPNEMLKQLFFMNEQTKLGQSNDLIAEVAGSLISGCVALAAQLDMASRDGAAQTVKPVPAVDEVAISPQTLIQRERESVDVAKAQQLASASFEVMNSEGMSQGQYQGQRMA